MSESAPAPASPTLWRTCRALANRRRLLLLRYLVLHPYRHVTEASQALRMPVAVASQYLRILNARGMLQPVRAGLRVYYRAAPDPSMPQAAILLNSLIKSYKKSGPASIDDIRFALTGFTHARRVQLVRAISGGRATIRSLSRKTGISRRATLRHMDKLRRRGYVERRGASYRIRRPLSSVRAALVRLALRQS